MHDIHLYTASTMNGWKPLIFLEEAEVGYELTPIDFSQKEQKSDWYMRLNPNGRIPTIVDRSNDDFVVFESGAILWYLAEKYGKFLPEDRNLRSQTLQWLMFQMSGIGPMMGQAMYFQRIAEPQGHRDEFAINRYGAESRRLLEVLNNQLDNKDYLVGDDFSIADIAMYPWARSYYWAKVSVDGLNSLKAWFERIDARPATQRALEIPKPFPAFFGKGDVATSEAANADRFKSDVNQ
ncbi:glutathione S-transferase [Leptolyngbyaceae cyanobacterium CCMR0082]|uniref:Glutathione S-transferase n=1 Tax=Adonisia turfae CCMR0082 TaxID=2304604 RepID=A0A6M0S0I1_9CYAN|nr:glutathione binding-like protein [Adonisia turfae]MDV3349301.1 glutathione binding-like protein [Leptothoe sp. LEGE 181152]NEZ61461.1 glutathione S-transferase [Adonisia turfae CCMR0082]